MTKKNTKDHKLLQVFVVYIRLTKEITNEIIEIAREIDPKVSLAKAKTDNWLLVRIDRKLGTRTVEFRVNKPNVAGAKEAKVREKKIPASFTSWLKYGPLGRRT